MAYLAVNKDETEVICQRELFRTGCYWSDDNSNGLNPYYADTTCELPKGSIEKLIGRKLTWEDEPIELI